ncbi:hypothetical protein F5Y17DRAFT_61341 [Xylariaceae sp. FL0594]|nr:hypothetical protein F5Y17DRAFT_61341 [Xylariaceae sp. FL0594]
MDDTDTRILPSSPRRRQETGWGYTITKKAKSKWDTGKVAVRALSVSLAVVAAIELVLLQSKLSAFFLEGAGYPILVAVVLWDVIELVVIITRRDISNGIRPEIHIGVELVLALGAGGTLAGLGATASWDEITNPRVDTWGQVVFTLVIILLILFIFRISFFTRACVEVARKRKRRKSGEAQRNTSVPQKQEGGLGSAHETDHQSSGRLTQQQPIQVQREEEEREEEERDFGYKYNNFPTAQAGVHPEEARNEKVLMGSIPR